MGMFLITWPGKSLIVSISKGWTFSRMEQTCKDSGRMEVVKAKGPEYQKGIGEAGTRTGTSCCKSGSSSICSLPPRKPQKKDGKEKAKENLKKYGKEIKGKKTSISSATSRPLLLKLPSLLTVTVVLVPSSSWTTSFMSVLS